MITTIALHLTQDATIRAFLVTLLIPCGLPSKVVRTLTEPSRMIEQTFDASTDVMAVLKVTTVLRKGEQVVAPHPTVSRLVILSRPAVEIQVL